MTIASKVEKIKNYITQCKEQVVNLGGTVKGSGLQTLASEIITISNGGNGDNGDNGGNTPSNGDNGDNTPSSGTTSESYTYDDIELYSYVLGDGTASNPVYVYLPFNCENYVSGSKDFTTLITENFRNDDTNLYYFPYYIYDALNKNYRPITILKGELNLTSGWGITLDDVVSTTGFKGMTNLYSSWASYNTTLNLSWKDTDFEPYFYLGQYSESVTFEVDSRIAQLQLTRNGALSDGNVISIYNFVDKL